MASPIPAPVRRALMFAPIVLLAMTAALSLHSHYAVQLDACYINRLTEKPEPVWIPLADSLLNDLSVMSIWGAILLLLTLRNDRKGAVYELAYSAQWFHVTYFLLAALKAPLADYNCAGRHALYPNGISGHYCYFLFVSLTAPSLIRSRLHQNPNASKVKLALPALLYAAFGVGSVATLYRTWMHGYHSPRQILLGSALGIASFNVLQRFFFDRDDRLRSRNFIALQLMTLASCALTFFALYQALWPLGSAGPALTRGHAIFHASVWVILLGCAATLTVKRSTD